MNGLHKSLIYGGAASLTVLNTRELVADGIKIHNLSGEAAELFGNALTFAAYLGGTLKSERGSLSVTVKCPQGGSVSVSCDKNLHVRGCMSGEAQNLLQGGTLTVISEDGYSRPFVGTCLMESTDFSQNLTEYFMQSAQTQTFVRVECKTEGDKCLAAGGVVVSLLPGADAAVYDECRQKVEGLTNIANEICAEGAGEYALRVFGGEELESLSPVYKCNCSRQKIGGVVRALGKEEARAIISEMGVISVHCHYCNTDYNFYADDVEELFK